MIKRFVDGLPLGLAIIAIFISVYAVIQKDAPQRTEIKVRPELEERLLNLPEDDPLRAVLESQLESQRILVEARDAANEAQNASQTTDSILSFIEGGSILIGVLLALVTVAFGSSLSDVRSRLDKSIEEAGGQLKQTEDRMTELMNEMRHQLQAGVEADHKRQMESDRRFSELNHRIQESLTRTESAAGGLLQMVDEAINSAKRDAENSFRVLSLLLLAEQQVRANNRETAIATLQEAIKIDPNNQTTNYLLGYLYVGRKRFEQAIEHLERALKIDPNFAPALAAMGLAQSRMANAEKDNLHKNQLRAQAEINLTKALTSDPGLIDADNESYFGTLGGIYRRQERLNDALTAYESAVKVTPNNSYPVGNLAMLYKKLNHEEQAQQMYTRVIEIAESILDDRPGDVWARLDYAQGLLIQGDKKKALDQYKNIIERAGETTPLETALSGLRFLVDTVVPIDGLPEVMNMLQTAIEAKQKEN